VGILSNLMTAAIAVPVRQAVFSAARSLETEGAIVQEVTVPHLEHALFAYFVLSSAEASSNLARYDGVRYGMRKEGETLEALYQNSRMVGFGEEVKRRIRLGTYALTRENKEAYYERSLAVQRALQAEFSALFKQFDLLLCPTAPDTAPLLGQMQSPTDLYHLDLCTVPMSLCGLPAISLPYGKDEKGLPIGLQLVGPPDSESLLYTVAERLEGGNKDAV
jgi:aspartyl-tRNA(Asn)/glutamyl-tRNA(Gln) amidotransferase subunit A